MWREWNPALRPLQLTSAPVKLPSLEAVNYTVHIYDEEELGYVETALQVAGQYSLALVEYNTWDLNIEMKSTRLW